MTKKINKTKSSEITINIKRNFGDKPLTAILFNVTSLKLKEKTA